MKNFEIPSKIVWRGVDLESPEKAFYPSFYRELSKKENFFKENFSYEFVDADIEKLKNSFFPLYEKEIMSREEYTLDKEKILSELENKISSSKIHKFLFIYHENELVYALLFSLKNGGLYFGYRAFKREVRKALLRKATASYWAEKLVFEFGKKQGVKFFSRGKDSHPFSGRKRLGLPLFKIKTGMKPRKPLKNTIFKTISLTEADIIKKNLPFMFFSEEGEDDFYSVCNLYCPDGLIEESFLNELKKVISWAGLQLIVVKY